MMIEHVMPKPSLTQNRWQAMYPLARSKYIENMEKSIRASNPDAEKAEFPVLVTIQRYSHKSLDPDNLVGGCKGIIDAIRRAGFAVDDTSQWMARRYEQHKTPTTKNRRTVITVEPITGDVPALSFEEFGFPARAQSYQRTLLRA